MIAPQALADGRCGRALEKRLVSAMALLETADVYKSLVCACLPSRRLATSVQTLLHAAVTAVCTRSYAVEMFHAVPVGVRLCSQT